MLQCVHKLAECAHPVRCRAIAGKVERTTLGHGHIDVLLAVTHVWRQPLADVEHLQLATCLFSHWQGNGLAELTASIWPLALILLLVSTLALKRYRRTLD